MLEAVSLLSLSSLIELNFYLSTGIERLKPTRFMFLIERADGKSGIYINCFQESVNFLFLTTKLFFGNLFIDFISLRDDLKKSRAWSPDPDACIAEAQFIVFSSSVEAEVNFTNAFKTKNETEWNLELILIRLMRLGSIQTYGSIIR